MKKAIFLILALCFLTVSCGNDNSGLTKAPDFTMQNYSGDELMLSDLYDKPVVLNFWASWCPPCKAELPDFEKMYQKYGNDVNFVIVNLVHSNNETMEKAKSHIEENGYTFPVYFDTKDEGGYFYHLESIPRTYFINTDGYIEHKVEQMITESGLEFGIELIIE